MEVRGSCKPDSLGQGFEVQRSNPLQVEGLGVGLGVGVDRRKDGHIQSHQMASETSAAVADMFKLGPSSESTVDKKVV